MTTIQTVAWSCWGGFILIMILVSVFQMRKLNHREKGMRTWPHAQAVVVGHQAVPGVSSGDGMSQSSSYLTIYEYIGPDGRSYQGKTVWSKIRPLPVRQSLNICVNPVSPAESYPIEKTSRVALGCTFTVMAVFGVGSFFFLRLLLRS